MLGEIPVESLENVPVPNLEQLERIENLSKNINLLLEKEDPQNNIVALMTLLLYNCYAWDKVVFLTRITELWAVTHEEDKEDAGV